MSDISKRTRRSALLASAAGLVLTGSVAVQAQNDSADDDESFEEVVVTGSRIARPNITASSPVTVLNSEAFDVIGAVDTIDLINTLPQAFAAQDTSFANGANGTSTVDLRGLGAIRTLVLANGKRLPYGSPTAGGFPPDINLIPAQLVERVEVLTGGASAVYGSDAIGGVTNFILKKDFEGISFDALYGFNQSNNGDAFARDALEAIGEDPVQGSVTDNHTYDISGIIGTNTADGRGNVTAYFRYLEASGIQQGDRDFSRCALAEFGLEEVFCLGSNQGPFPTTFVISPAIPEGGLPADAVPLIGADGNPILNADGEPITSGAFSLNSDGSLSSGFNNAFNFNPDNPIRRAVDRINAGLTAHYAVTDEVEAYMEFGYTRSNSPQVIAPSAAFGSAISSVNCDNPVLTDEQRAIICGNPSIDGPFPRDLDGDGFAQAEVRRRFVEGGPRTDDRTLSNYRFVYGLRGQLGDAWNWDAFGQLGRTDLTRLQINQVTSTNLERALDIVSDPTTGQPVCRSVVDGTDPNCVPFLTAYDPNATVDPGLAAYVDTPTLTQGEIRQTIWGASIQGDLTDYGIVSPFAETGVALIIGGEYRRDRLSTQADGTNQGGLLVGAGGAVLPTDGETEVYEFFAEAQIPLVQDKQFAKELTLTAAYRRSEYDSVDILNAIEGGDFGTDTYAFGLSWAPIDDFRVRAQYQRAIRAPNVGELFLPVNTGLTSLSDPCAGFAGTSEPPTASFEACQNTGVTAAQFGAIPPDSGQLNVLTGGNVNLQPEVSDTFTVGVVVTPSAIPGLTLSVDYYNIELEDVIDTIPPSFTLQRCLDTGDAQFCDLINRGPDGSLTFTPREQANIVANSRNIASAEVTGFDFQVGYNLGLADYGDLNFNYVGTYQLDDEQTPLPGAGTFDCVGFFDQGCGNPSFDYRSVLTTRWQTPWDVTVAANWRYFSSVDRVASIDTDSGDVTTFGDNGDGNLTTATLESQSYVDLTVFWEVTDYLTLRAGARNILDNDPPVLTTFGPSPTANVEANTVAGVYDAGGRFIFFGANVSF